MTAVPVHFCSLMAHNKEHTFVQTCPLHVDLQTSAKSMNVAFTVQNTCTAYMCSVHLHQSTVRTKSRNLKYFKQRNMKLKDSVPLNVPLKQNMNKNKCVIVFCDWLISKRKLSLFMTSQSH